MVVVCQFYQVVLYNYIGLLDSTYDIQRAELDNYCATKHRLRLVMYLEQFSLPSHTSDYSGHKRSILEMGNSRIEYIQLLSTASVVQVEQSVRRVSVCLCV